MTETIKSSVDKICQENDCSEKMTEFSSEQRELFKSFTYCPYCAQEMTLVCNHCHEQLSSSDFKFCPWCGTSFSE